MFLEQALHPKAEQNYSRRPKSNMIERAVFSFAHTHRSVAIICASTRPSTTDCNIKRARMVPAGGVGLKEMEYLGELAACTLGGQEQTLV